MLMRSLVVAAMLALAPLSLHAQSFVDASDADIIAGLIQDEGYRAVVGSDGVGDPMITSSANGYDFEIYFYGCTDGEIVVTYSSAFYLTLKTGCL